MYSIIYQINSLICVTVASALPTYPLTFKQSGWIISTIILMVQGLISARTKSIYAKNMKFPSERIDAVVSRELGRKWGQCYIVISIIYIMQIVLFYSFYALSIFYQIVSYFDGLIQNQDAQSVKNQSLNAVSTLIIGPYIIFLIIKNSEKKIKKLKSFTYFLRFLSIILYLSFIFYIFFCSQNSYDTEDQAESISFIQIAKFLSNNNLAFENQLCQHQIVTFNGNKLSKESLFSIKYSNILVFFIYAIVGNLGYFSIKHLNPIDPDQNNIIFDYFNDNPYSLTVKILLVYHFLQGSSYQFVLLKNLLQEFLLNSTKIKEMDLIKRRLDIVLKILFSIFLVMMNLTSSNFQYKFTIISGSLAGFFLIYLVPYKLKFKKNLYIEKVLSKRNNKSIFQKSLKEAQEEELDIKPLIDENQLDSNKISKKTINLYKYNQMLITKNSKFIDNLILIFGFFISMFGIFYFISNLINV